jgi:hypothetical protein
MKTIVLALMTMPFLSLSQTKKEVYDYILNSGIKEPKIVMKQVLLETGNLKCIKCSMRHNNLLGFYNGRNYLKFSSWQKSIDFYKFWQLRKGFDGGNYYEFLKRKWGAPNMNNYVNKLKQINL